MKKHIFLVAFVICSVASFGQEIRKLSGFNPITGRPGYIYRDTSIVIPYTTNKYFTGYKTFGSLLDTARIAISLTTSGSGAATYNSATGVINVPTPAGGVGGGQADSAYFWQKIGNYGTDTALNFVGTTDNTKLIFRVANIKAGSIDSSSQNTTLGVYAGWKIKFNRGASTGLKNVAIGLGALSSDTSGNTNIAIGVTSLKNNRTGDGNIAVGNQALFSNTTGSNSIAVGGDALGNNTTGSSGVAIGTFALNSQTTGANNVGVGNFVSQQNQTGGNNTAVGHNALFSNTAGNNSAFGLQALKNNTTGTDNTALGINALFANTTGTFNVGIGETTGFNATTGTCNVYIGYQAGSGNVGGSYNTIIGANVIGLPSTLDSNVIIANGRGNQRINANAKGRVGIGTGTTIDASAILEVKGTDGGLLLPRMTKTQRDAIASPATGLAVFQTDNTPGLRVYNGTNWMKYTETAD